MMKKLHPHKDEPVTGAGGRVKVWTGLGTVMLAGAALSLAPSVSHAGLLDKAGKPVPGASPPVQLAQQGGEGGEAGEGGEGGGGGGGGEGGEGGEGAAVHLAEDDGAYLTQLGLVRGHLEVGMDLYRQGEHAAAEPHMAHPAEELYEALEPALEARGAPSFEEQLEALDHLVEKAAPVDEVEAAYRKVLEGVSAAEASVPEASRADLAHRFDVIVNLVRTAGREYAEALDDDGKVVNAVEYQDALGFVRTAQAMLDAIKQEGSAAAAKAVMASQEQLDGVALLWPSVVPPESVAGGDPSELYGAAARIEIAALRLK
jgi:hypothetical protein